MGYIVDIENEMTPRMLIKKLVHAIGEEYMDKPIEEFETYHEGGDEYDPHNVSRIEIKRERGILLRVYSR